ncbi:MAG: alpha/beta hydrolase [Telmatospirillum sp.]|nr:alpha/beta hydrolase [Telmatospirillum sp.]
MITTVAVLSLLAVLAYLAVAGAMALMQRRLLYLPGTAAVPRETGVERPPLTPVAGEDRLLGWWLPPAVPDAPVLVFFHGNRGTLRRIADKTATWPGRFGIGLFLATYRGYEGNPGKPTEQGLYQDGRTILDWLAARSGTGRDRILLYGESLGSGVATQMAAEGRGAALILEAAFTSIVAIAQRRYPWAPVRWLLRDRFDNLSKIGVVGIPTLLLHGDADPTVPVDHARRMAAAAPSAQLAVVSGATHLDIHQKGGTDVLADFLNGIILKESKPDVRLPSPSSSQIMPDRSNP